MLAVEYLKGHVFESWLVHFYLFCFVLSYYVINKHVSVFFCCIYSLKFDYKLSYKVFTDFSEI